ncbi:MAG: BrnT family toxin [Smithellaceae bacterium]|jgi:uncharacterized protein|nr:BrnT family toxin [Smithellaceae bacterium]MDD3848763.1 BrnT family toxin [Smithellaceae bacterium]
MIDNYTWIIYIVCVKFAWDPDKDRMNRKKHGVAFEEAMTVFYDSEALLISDPDHSDDEDRFIILGLSSKLKELVVSFCERVKEANEETIRIISARKADKTEREEYWQKRKL